MRKLQQCLFILCAANFFINPLHSINEPERILYLLRSGNSEAAFKLYEQYRIESRKHHLDLIQSMSLALLEQGYRTKNPEIQMMTLFGAGISGDENALYILEEGIKSDVPQFQLISINFLARFQDDQAIELINAAMSSNSLPIRLEAVFNLAKNNNPKAVGQIEALMQKVPPQALPVFPQLFAMCGDRNSINCLRKLLTHPDCAVRIQAILSCAKFGRDDLLPEIRKLSTHFNVGEQEACATALGTLKDETSVKRLSTLANSGSLNVKIAALEALYRMGREETRYEMEKLANQQHLLAILPLGNMQGSEETLCKLAQSPNLNVRLNAGLALLKLHHPQCVKPILEILIKDHRDLAFTMQNSHGTSLISWKAVPSAKQNLANNSLALEISLHMRENVLEEAIELPEETFLTIANAIFQRNQNDLVPLLTQLLVNHQSTNSIQLLKHFRDTVGSPLIRNYCNLALFRLKETGPYASSLHEWVTKHHDRELIQFRPLIPWELRKQEASHYQLYPEDASRLLVESFEALVQNQDSSALDILLNAIRYGNNTNRYALAGLLMRTAH